MSLLIRKIGPYLNRLSLGNLYGIVQHMKALVRKPGKIMHPVRPKMQMLEVGRTFRKFRLRVNHGVITRPALLCIRSGLLPKPGQLFLRL